MQKLNVYKNPRNARKKKKGKYIKYFISNVRVIMMFKGSLMFESPLFMRM